MAKKDISKYDQLVDEIVGYGVSFPLLFLNDEDFKKLKQFEFGLMIVPSHIFT